MPGKTPSSVLEVIFQVVPANVAGVAGVSSCGGAGVSSGGVVGCFSSSSSSEQAVKFSYISKFHILISYKLTIYIVMCFYQGTN